MVTAIDASRQRAAGPLLLVAVHFALVVSASQATDWNAAMGINVIPNIGFASGTLAGDIEVVAEKHVPQRNTVLIRVPPAAILSANSTTELALSVAQLLSRERANDSATEPPPFAAYVRELSRSQTVTTLPALALTDAQANACLAGHMLRLYAVARQSLNDTITAAAQAASSIGEGGPRVTRSDVRAAWAIVRTRSMSIPRSRSRANVTFPSLIPAIDFANHDGVAPAARVEYQRHADASSGARVDELDVLLVNTAPLKRGVPVRISYGNIRHPIDAVDTYGFRWTAAGGEHATNLLLRDFPLLPVQMVFPRDVTYFVSRGCNNASRMVFDAATGQPAPEVLPCVALAHLKARSGTSEVDAVLSMQSYATGTMPKAERRQLNKVAWTLLAQQAAKLREDQYTLKNRGACATTMTVLATSTSARSKAAVDVVTSATLATMFMRDAYDRLVKYSTDRAEGIYRGQRSDAAPSVNRDVPSEEL